MEPIILGIESSCDDTSAAVLCGTKMLSNVIASRPWFYPVSGFDKILGTDRENNPVLVQKRRHNVNHYFSTLTTPHVDILRELIRRAGVHMYSHDSRHIMHIGNDVIFITDTGDGTTSVNLPAGRKLR